MSKNFICNMIGHNWSIHPDKNEKYICHVLRSCNRCKIEEKKVEHDWEFISEDLGYANMTIKEYKCRHCPESKEVYDQKDLDALYWSNYS